MNRVKAYITGARQKLSVILELPRRKKRGTEKGGKKPLRGRWMLFAVPIAVFCILLAFALYVAACQADYSGPSTDFEISFHLRLSANADSRPECCDRMRGACLLRDLMS